MRSSALGCGRLSKVTCMSGHMSPGWDTPAWPHQPTRSLPCPGARALREGLQGSHRGRNHVPCVHLGSGHGPLTPGAGAADTGLVRVEGRHPAPCAPSRDPWLFLPDMEEGPQEARASVQHTLTVKTAGRMLRPTPPPGASACPPMRLGWPL